MEEFRVFCGSCVVFQLISYFTLFLFLHDCLYNIRRESVGYLTTGSDKAATAAKSIRYLRVLKSRYRGEKGLPRRRETNV